MLRKVLLSLVFYILVAFGISLTIKASIGVSSFNALNVAISRWLRIEVGTITGILNLLFLMIAFLIDSKKDWKEYGLIIISLILLSNAINFFVYILFPYFRFESYLSNIFFFIIGTCIAGIGTGRILYYGILNFPIEKCCQLLELVTHRPFSLFRYSFDIIFVTSSILISLIAHLPFFVREGTLLSLLILSYVIGKARS